MSEDTTTSDVDETQAADEPQLEDNNDNTEAVNQDEDTSQTSDNDETGSVEDNSEDSELKDWAAKKNLPLDDPIKMAKIIRDSEKELGKRGQKEGQLKNAVSSANEASSTDDYQALKNEVEALSFYVNHPEAKQLESEMVTILEEKPWLASDLESVLDIAKGRSFSDPATLLAAKQAGGKEALDRAESAARGARPRTSATNPDKPSTKITPDNVDQVIGQHMGDAKWYKAHEAEINAALAG